MDTKFLKPKGGVKLVTKSGEEVNIKKERKKQMKQKVKKKTAKFEENMTKVNKIIGGY